MCFTECFDQHVGEQMKQVKHIFLYYLSCQKYLCSVHLVAPSEEEHVIMNINLDHRIYVHFYFPSLFLCHAAL